MYNNVSLDGGDYNNGFFGEQLGGQRAAIDITLEAVKEFQVVASGANAEFGRTAGGVVNVITKSGTNEVGGSLFHFQRLEGLTADASDGTPPTDFHREQFGGTVVVRSSATNCSISSRSSTSTRTSSAPISAGPLARAASMCPSLPTPRTNR